MGCADLASTASNPGLAIGTQNISLPVGLASSRNLTDTFVSMDLECSSKASSGVLSTEIFEFRDRALEREVQGSKGPLSGPYLVLSQGRCGLISAI
jgi:hypothetical protein